MYTTKKFVLIVTNPDEAACSVDERSNKYVDRLA
jgi:hypothetical protein